MNRNFGKKLSESLKQSDPIFTKIMGHVQEQNSFRQKVPCAFHADAYDNTAEFEQLMQKSFKPVAIPLEITKQREADRKLGRKKPSVGAADALQDDKYVRRLKMANYGRWFIKPQDYMSKLERLN